MMAPTLSEFTLSGFWEIRSHSSCQSCECQKVRVWSNEIHAAVVPTVRGKHTVSAGGQVIYLVVRFALFRNKVLVIHHSR